MKTSRALPYNAFHMEKFQESDGKIPHERCRTWVRNTLCPVIAGCIETEGALETGPARVGRETGLFGFRQRGARWEGSP